MAILIGLVLVTISLVIGIFIGTKVSYKLYVPAQSDQYIAEVTFLQVIAEALDKKDNETARKHVLSELNANVAALLEIESLEKNIEIKVKINKVLRSVAEYRKNNPHLYSSTENDPMNQVISDQLKEIVDNKN